jgi:streptogramin lyase
MRSRVLLLCVALALSVVLAATALSAATAGAAEPTLYQLPEATHASMLAPADGGTVWFDPLHGSLWKGSGDADLGQVTDGGTVGELSVPGFKGEPVAGPHGEVWVPGTGENAAGEGVLLVGRLSSSGTITQTLTVGRDSALVVSMAVGPNAVWVALSKKGAREWVDRVPTGGAGVKRAFAVGSNCDISAMEVAADRTLWFAEACEQKTSEGWGPGRSSIGQVNPSGKVARRRVPGLGIPESLALGPHGTVWFGVVHTYVVGGEIDRIRSSGSLAEYPVPNGLPYSIAVGRGGRLWFQSSFGGGIHRALDWIDPGGKLGKPICADPACELEPLDLTAAPDGSLWYSLWKPHSIGGGCGTQIAEGIEIENEAGFVGHLLP